MNPYQRITRGTVNQAGHIDTAAKFAQLTAGVDLRGKSVLDVGCNLGEMCRLAKEAGASTVRGVDIEPEYIYDARKIAPDDGIVYDCTAADRISGNWDVIIASAVLHYVDIDRALAQFARCAQVVLCDVWLDKDWAGEVYARSNRGLYVPNPAAWQDIAMRHFGWVGDVWRAARVDSPDDSPRFAFVLDLPKPKPARAVLLYGRSGTGKTSRGRDLRYGKGFEHLELDSVFIEWRINMEPGPLSVSDFVDGIWEDGQKKRRSKYLAFYEGYIHGWLDARQNLDVVIEGYDMIDPIFRSMVRLALMEKGWSDVAETECL